MQGHQGSYNKLNQNGFNNNTNSTEDDQYLMKQGPNNGTNSSSNNSSSLSTDDTIQMEEAHDGCVYQVNKDINCKPTGSISLKFNKIFNFNHC